MQTSLTEESAGASEAQLWACFRQVDRTGSLRQSYPEVQGGPKRFGARELEEEGSHGNPQGGEARRVAQSAEEAPGEGEGLHPDARPAEPGAARSALGARRKALYLRGRARDADTQRPLRGSRPTGHLSR